MKTIFKARAGAGIVLGLVIAMTSPSSVVAAPAIQLAQAEIQHSEEGLRAYAFALASVKLIQGGLDRQLIDAADDPQATQELQSEADAQMNAAIQRSGLTMVEYETMTEQVTADTELAQTVQDYVDEEMGIVR